MSNTAGGPRPTMATMLGQADISTTAIYTTTIGAQARELGPHIWA